MLRKNIASLLIFSLLGYTSCSSLEVISKKDLDEGRAQLDHNEELYITTKDSSRYYFPPWNYQILNDTLYGDGTLTKAGTEIPFKGEIAIDDITIFEQGQVDTGTTTGLTLGVIALGVVAVGILLLAAISDTFNPD